MLLLQDPLVFLLCRLFKARHFSIFCTGTLAKKRGVVLLVLVLGFVWVGVGVDGVVVVGDGGDCGVGDVGGVGGDHLVSSPKLTNPKIYSLWTLNVCGWKPQVHLRSG